MKTNRGFEYISFLDSNKVECSIQESSSVEPKIWVGVNDADPKIMTQNGWCEYNIPEEVLCTTRMHLTRKQALYVAKKLIKFYLFKKL